MNQRKAKIGDTIQIKKVQSETKMFPGGVDTQALELVGKTGVVESIDDAGTLRGTWGSLGVIEEDEYEILSVNTL